MSFVSHFGSTVVHYVHIVSYIYLDCLACRLLLIAFPFPAYFYYLNDAIGLNFKGQESKKLPDSVGKLNPFVQRKLTSVAT